MEAVGPEVSILLMQIKEVSEPLDQVTLATDA